MNASSMLSSSGNHNDLKSSSHMPTPSAPPLLTNNITAFVSPAVTVRFIVCYFSLFSTNIHTHTQSITHTQTLNTHARTITCACSFLRRFLINSLLFSPFPVQSIAPSHYGPHSAVLFQAPVLAPAPPPLSFFMPQPPPGVRIPSRYVYLYRYLAIVQSRSITHL